MHGRTHEAWGWTCVAILPLPCRVLGREPATRCQAAKHGADFLRGVVSTRYRGLEIVERTHWHVLDDRAARHPGGVSRLRGGTRVRTKRCLERGGSPPVRQRRARL
ncbi:hypothetical protein BV20DRAFT_745235 [Pilatotrama ljubarskyi]|nr:hypothetical protein BV20DRAFT_745235 [Pilatotrama ljubarskyi]